VNPYRTLAAYIWLRLVPISDLGMFHLIENEKDLNVHILHFPPDNG
jgi:hypothetical protein